MSHEVQPVMTTVAGRLYCIDVSGLNTPNARLKTTLCADAGTHELCVFKMGTRAGETYLGCRSCVFTSSKVLSDVNAEAMGILSMRAQLEQTAVLDFYDVAQPMANKLPPAPNVVDVDSAAFPNTVTYSAGTLSTKTPIEPRNLARTQFNTAQDTVASNRRSVDDDDFAQTDAHGADELPQEWTSPERKEPDRTQCARYRVNNPTVYVFSDDDDDAKVPSGAGWDALPNDATRERAYAATKAPVSSKTMKKYNKWIKQHWKPFAKKMNIQIYQVTPEQVVYWIEKMMEKGSMSRGTIINYINAACWLWKQHDNNRGKVNPFLSEEVLHARSGLSTRIKCQRPLDVRTGVTPADMKQIKDGVKNSLQRFKQLYASHATYDKFDVSELRNVRAGVACLIGYTFGLRAQSLYFLESQRLIVDFGDESKFGLVADDEAPGDKTHAHGAARSGLDREMSRCAWSKDLRQIFLDYHECVRTFYSVRLTNGASKLSKESLQNDEQQCTAYLDSLEPEYAEQEWWSRKNQLTFEELPTRVFHLPFLSSVGSCGCRDELDTVTVGNENQTVSSWLNLARHAFDCPKASDGKRYTSHSLRIGAASAFHCVQPVPDMPRLNWWFRWNASSSSAQDHYIDMQWTRRAHPDADYFWAALARRD